MAYVPYLNSVLDVSQNSTDTIWTNNRKILAANNIFPTDAGAGSTYTQQVEKTTVLTAASTTFSATTTTCQYASAGNGSMFLSLPAAASNTDKKYLVKKIDAAVTTVYLVPNGADTFEGSATWLSLANQYNWYIIQSDGSASWKIIGQTVGGGSAPIDATYVTVSSNSTLTAERVLTAGKNTFLTDAGANSTITVEVGPVTNITGDTSLSATSNTVITVDASGGAVAVTLPAASNTNKLFRIKKVDSSANAVTVTRAGSDTIDGATTFVLSVQYQAVDVAAGATSNQWNIY